MRIFVHPVGHGMPLAPRFLQLALLGGGLALSVGSSGTAKHSADSSVTIVHPPCVASRPPSLKQSADRYSLSCRYNGGTPDFKFLKQSGAKNTACPKGTYRHGIIITCDGAKFDPKLLPAKNPVVGGIPTTAAEKAAWAKAILEAHNTYRAALRLQPLQWSDRLAGFAAQWSAHIAKLGGTRLVKSDLTKTGQGENLWLGAAGSLNHAMVVRAWGRMDPLAEAKIVGCAVARAGGNDILVCRYWPPSRVDGPRP